VFLGQKSLQIYNNYRKYAKKITFFIKKFAQFKKKQYFCTRF